MVQIMIWPFLLALAIIVTICIEVTEHAITGDLCASRSRLNLGLIRNQCIFHWYYHDRRRINLDSRLIYY